MDEAEAVAHLKNSIAGTEIQSVSSHLENTARLAGSFAAAFGNTDWAECAGFWHDLGKLMPDWQKYIRGEKSSTSVKHSHAGAVWAFQRFAKKYGEKCPINRIIPYLIAGHHAGLPDWTGGSGQNLENIIYDVIVQKINTSETDSLQSMQEYSCFLEKPLPVSRPFPLCLPAPDFPEYTHLWIRMLYSCLVDADFLDTEAFMDPDQYASRGKYASIHDLKLKFDTFMKQKTAGTRPSAVNDVRAVVLSACREKAENKPGFFTLNVPTGGGKTLSSMAFALAHAVRFQKKRIIVAIPYTSIIEQTAKVYKYGTDDNNEIEERIKAGDILFGESNVLEHHSGFDFDSNDSEKIELYKKLKLSTENWDAPIIVTTNVQLFESLFASKSSACRKLHTIANSIVILDEVQMLPPEFLKSIVSVLQGLVKYLGVTVVLCSATQPDLSGDIGSDSAHFCGITEPVTPIIEHPDDLADSLKRVTIHTDLTRESVADWSNIAERLQTFEQVLCIVQTRKDCRDLHRLMPEGTIHLSALMCAEERSDIITRIKQYLKRGESVRVISTQLVECGVDIDFPIVFRALAGFDSVAQSAGRCNREGKLRDRLGDLYLFSPPKASPPGLLRKGADATKSLLEKYQYELKLAPALYRDYFRLFYNSVNDFDKPHFGETMQKEASDCKFQFRTLAENYHLIDDSYQAAVFVRYTSPETGRSSLELLEKLRNGEADRAVFRKLGRYSVSLPVREVENLEKEGRIIRMQDCFIQEDDALYQEGLGLVADSLPSFKTYIY